MEEARGGRLKMTEAKDRISSDGDFKFRFYLKFDTETSDTGPFHMPRDIHLYVYHAHTCIFGGCPRKLTDSKVG